MSDAVFPTLAGLAWGVIKQPQYKTTIQKAVSGRELRLAFMLYPMYTFKLQYNVLRDDRSTNNTSAPKDELKKLLKFFLARRGSFDSFLFTDPTDCAVTQQVFGAGNGVDKTFQLVRAYGVLGDGFVEPVENLNGAAQIYVNGVLQESGYNISSTGAVTFTVAPALGVSLTWTGQYYFRVRFEMDSAEFNNFMYDLWELKKCDLYGSLQNKI
jgi:uncharacterized protein (TIGR02217 family)